MVFKSLSDRGALLKPQGILNVLFCSLEVKYVYAILDSTLGLEPRSVTTAPRYLKLPISSNFRRWS